MEYYDKIQKMISQLKHNHRMDVKEFIKVRRRIDRVSEKTAINDIQAILIIDKHINKAFKDITANDIQDWEEYVRSHPQSNIIDTPYSSSTIDMYLAKLKIFLKFVHYPDEYKRGKKFRKKIPDPKCTEWISIKHISRDIPADYILKDDDIKQMLSICDNLRDAAMIALLYDAGLRNSELRNLKIKSVTINQQGGEVILPVKADENKTGTRKIFIITSVPYLKQYLNYHPFKDYPDAPLFYSREPLIYGNAIKKMSEGKLSKDDFDKLKLSRTSIICVVRSAGKRACMKISIYPHLLRHSSATNYAHLGLTDAEMRIRYGWSKTSNMPSKYIHIASNDMNNKILKLNGITPDNDNDNEDKLKSITCPDCGLKNPSTFSFCGNCRMPLNIDVVKNQKDLDTEPDILKMVNDDPEKAKEAIKSLLPMIDDSIPKEYQKKINEWIES